MREPHTALRLALATLAAFTALAGVASAGTTYGEQGVPVDPDCATDPGGDETMAMQGDGSIAFPGFGCTATYGKSGATGITAITYRATGGIGQVCGLFEFTGAFVGLSEVHCTTDGSNVTAAVTVEPGSGTNYNVTWRPTSYRHHNAYLCTIQTEGGATPLPPLECAAWVHDAQCLPGLTVAPGPGQAEVDWPDVPGTYYYNVSAVRLEPRPVRLNDAAAGGFEGSQYTFRQAAGTYTYSAASFGPDNRVVALFCPVTAAVPAGTDVPFFTGRIAFFAASTAVLAAAFVLLRRRPS